MLSELAGRFASALKARGVKPGDRVVAQIEKSVGAIALYLGCLQTGAIYVPLNTAYTDAEVEFFLQDCEPVLMVRDARRSVLWNASATMDTTPDTGLWAEASRLEPSERIETRSGDDIAAICYTSGTTGRPKGAMITHSNMAHNANALIDLWRFTADDVLLHILPVFHVHGLFVATHCALFSGATILLETRFNAARVLNLLPHATTFMGVPTHYTRLLAEMSFDGNLAKQMRLFISGSAPLLAETHREFEQRTGHRILERYGMSEAGIILSNPYEGERAAGTVGYPLPGVQTRVIGAEGQEVPDGEVGVLQIRGPNVFIGYWHRPDATEESFTSDGWFVTGDLVNRAADGRYTIVGREKDLIIAGGYNIYPKEIEEALDLHVGVAESAVIGVPHPDFGESVVAIVVPAEKGSVNVSELAALAEERLARFKLPRAYHIVESLPRNAMGKVQKDRLRAEFAP